MDPSPTLERHVQVRVASASGVWTADIDLDNGIVRRSGLRAGAPSALPPETLAALIEAAETLHATGDRVRRSQFASGEAHFRVTLGGRTVTHSVYDEGGTLGERLDLMLKVARGP